VAPPPPSARHAMDELGHYLRTHSLARVAAGLLTQAQDSLRLTVHAVEETTLPIAASKVGGLPDLPRDLAWPASNGHPQAFVAQINLADAAGYGAVRALPRSGLLSFFYDNGRDLDEEDDEDDEDDEDEGDEDEEDEEAQYPGCAVFFFDGDPSTLNLARRQAPASLATEDRFVACAVDITPIVTLPAPESFAIASLGFDEREQEDYVEVYLGWNRGDNDRDGRPAHRLLGLPYNLEGDARVASLLASRGQTWDDVADMGDIDDAAAEAELERAATDWTLLLQVDSDDAAGMDWQGGGLIYFCLTRAALEAGDFSAVWATTQFL